MPHCEVSKLRDSVRHPFLGLQDLSQYHSTELQANVHWSHQAKLKGIVRRTNSPLLLRPCLDFAFALILSALSLDSVAYLVFPSRWAKTAWVFAPLAVSPTQVLQ